MSKQSPTAKADALVIRPLTAADEPVLELLAELDSATPLRGPALIAELRGRPVAALALSDGRSIADPFLPTRDVVALLRLRAHQISDPAAGRGGPLIGWTSPRQSVRHARDRLHRRLERAHVAVQHLNRRQQPVEHQR